MPSRQTLSRVPNVDTAEVLRACEVVSDWPDDARSEFAALGRVVHHARGVLLHRHGSPHSRFYVVLEGAVEFSRVLPDGRQYVMPYVPAGQLVGIAALLGKQPHLFDVRARVESTLLEFPGDAARDFLLSRPEQLMSIAAALSRRYSRLFEQMEVLSMMSLRQRLARVLLELATSFGRPREDGIEISLRVAQEDLAGMTAASRQRVNVELGSLVDKRILDVHYGRINISDIERLREMAGRISTE
jgi:CRP-like cAMP-binding protein